MQLSADDLRSIVAEAVALGVEQGIAKARQLIVDDQPIDQAEFMKLAGYRDYPSFRNWMKQNGIVPVETQGRRNYYLPSQARNAQRVKGVHLK